MTAQTEKPNVLFIMDDQHRFDYLGCAGASFIDTPNLDRLAERGMMFTHCMTNAPICTPARIGLATGLHPFRVGSLDNRSFLPRSATTYYQRLRDHGYRVGCIGKLDLAKPDNYNGRYGDRPCVFGWGFTHPEECEGKMHAGSSKTPIGPYTHYLQERGLLEDFHDDYRARAAKGWIKDASHDSVLPTDAFEDSYIGTRAADWIEKVPDDFPWHLFVSFAGPHDPFDPPTEYAERYRGAEMPEPIPPQPQGKPNAYAAKQKGLEPAEIAVTRRQYCAAIELIDHQVGLMLDALEQRGQLDSTLIVFASDHGEMLGDHGQYTKNVAYESALHVPLLIAGPGIPNGKVSGTLVELNDVNPTICEAAGVPRQEDIDARSLFPFMRGTTDTHRQDALSVLKHFQCLRTDTHKLIINHNDCAELYDLVHDPEETNNIAEQNPDFVRELNKRMRARQLEGKWLR